MHLDNSPSQITEPNPLVWEFEYGADYARLKQIEVQLTAITELLKIESTASDTQACRDLLESFTDTISDQLDELKDVRENLGEKQ